MTESPAALAAREVWKAFERMQPLSGVSFALSAEEVHAMVEANGRANRVSDIREPDVAPGQGGRIDSLFWAT